MIRKVVSSIRMLVGLVRRIKLKKYFNAFGEVHLVFFYCNAGNEVSMLEKFAG
jgi:hypothetical protein